MRKPTLLSSLSISPTEHLSLVSVSELILVDPEPSILFVRIFQAFFWLLHLPSVSLLDLVLYTRILFQDRIINCQICYYFPQSTILLFQFLITLGSIYSQSSIFFPQFVICYCLNTPVKGWTFPRNDSASQSIETITSAICLFLPVLISPLNLIYYLLTKSGSIIRVWSLRIFLT
jgi:hypothetical protein